MMHLQVSLAEEVVATGATAAHERNMEFDEYIAWLILNDADNSNVAHGRPVTREDEQSAAQLARRLFVFALEQQAEEVDDEHNVEAIPYLIEELYRGNVTGRPWAELSVGIRKAIGKEFKKLVDQQVKGGCQIEDGRQMRVEFTGRTAQNQARYKTVRVG
jgi:hypothetical protein